MINVMGTCIANEWEEGWKIAESKWVCISDSSLDIQTGDLKIEFKIEKVDRNFFRNFSPIIN